MEYLAHLFAEFLLKHTIRYFLCIGEYGVGKTTLIRYIVSMFPSYESFEILSPSFTTYNIYPTSPPSIHIDLYNTEYSLMTIMEELEEIESPLVFVEWANRSQIFPNEPFLSCVLSYACASTRIISCELHLCDSHILQKLHHKYNTYLT